MVALWSLVGWVLVHPLEDSSLERGDERAVRWFAERRTPTWDSLSLVGSWLSETIVKIVVTALVCLLLLRLMRRWFEASVVAVTLILEAMVFITTTKIVGRPRPDVPRLESSPVGSSFPSGHVAAAVCYGAIAVVVFWHTRKVWARALAVCITALVPPIVALARMYRGMHHPTDVAAGFVIGLMCLIVVTTVLQRAERRRLGGATPTLPTPSDSHDVWAPEPQPVLTRSVQ
jgi:undecaprenyl-diphosphatase